MGRALSIAVFAATAGAAALAGSGVAVPAHRMPAGTPPAHSMPLAAYRLGFLIEPAGGTEPLTPAMAALHRALATAGGLVAMEMPAPETDAGTSFRTSALAPIHDLAVALALLVVLVPRLPRPARRLITVLVPPAIVPSQWGPAVPLAPPRGVALRAARAEPAAFDARLAR